MNEFMNNIGGPAMMILGFAWLMFVFAQGIRMSRWMGQYGPGVARRFGIEPSSPVQAHAAAGPAPKNAEAALLAGAAKRLGIPEEKLREWLAEGRVTIQDRPGEGVQ